MQPNDRYRIRPGRAEDTADLARLHASVQLQTVTGGQPHPGIAAWVEDLMEGHPSVRPEDFLVAEETATGRPVAGLVDLRQDWSLAGIRLPVAQIELVGTEPEHRGNRLTERLFAALHERHATDGVPLQVIEGIPYFYRRLGYEYAMANDGAPKIPAAALPTGHDGPFTVRPATADDADALARIDQRLADGDALVCPRDAEVWRYEIAGRRSADAVRRVVKVLVHSDDVRGYLIHTARLSPAGELTVLAAACEQPSDWPLAVTAMYADLGKDVTAVRLLLDPGHPLARFGPAGIPARPRGWYARTGDPAGLITRLLPLLRDRWDAAGLRWPEPALTIDTYGRAARIEFAGGRPESVTALRSSGSPDAHAAIPPGALLQLALGYRTLPEVLDAWPDCLPRDRLTEQFLTVAFPRVPVRVWPRN